MNFVPNQPRTQHISSEYDLMRKIFKLHEYETDVFQIIHVPEHAMRILVVSQFEYKFFDLPDIQLSIVIP